MSSLIAARKNIRKALEKPLITTLTAAGMGSDIRWIGGPTFIVTDHAQYIEPQISWGEPVVREMGRTPVHDMVGSYVIAVHTAPRLTEDENDRIQAIIAAGYVYGNTLTNGGTEVYVDKLSPGGYAKDDAWLVGLMRVHWQVLRRV